MSRNVLLISILIAVVSWPQVAAQAIQPGVPGFAEITEPAPDQALNGLLTIRGTAFHPDFESYEIFFSYDPNPTGTWFPLTEQIDTPVQEDGLALWDTSGITPGRYQLRLLVHSNQGQTVEAIVGGLRVGTGSSAEAQAIEQPSVGQPEIEELSPDQSELESAAEPAAGQPLTPEQTLLRLVLTGAIAAVTILLSFGAYSVLRPRVRDYVGLLRIRQRHRDNQRADRGRRSEQ